MKNLFLYLTFALVLVLYNCSKDDNGDNNGNGDETGFNETCSPSDFPGLQIAIDGDISDEVDPTSEQFNDYIACVQDCAETDPNDPQCMMDCMSILGVLPPGAPFSLTVRVTNISSIDITYVIEPGDWFEPASGDYQPMMSPISISVVVTPGETITITIPVYCLASGLSAPDEDAEYSMCEIIASSGCLKDIVAILETKDLSGLDFTSSMEVQQVIWNCIDGEEVDWDYLNNLPSL